MDFLFKGGMLTDPTTNGVTVFVLGIIFILSLYHLFLYFQNRERAFLLYSLYTFLIFVRHSFLSQGDFFDMALSPYETAFVETGMKDFTIWIYNCIYFFFIFEFVDLHYKDKLVNKIFIGTPIVLAGLAIIVELITLITGNREIMTFCFSNIFVPVIVVASLVALYSIFVSRSSVRYYAFFGLDISVVIVPPISDYTVPVISVVIVPL
jgi:hypothetical protein